jgi:hypothetical protein
LDLKLHKHDAVAEKWQFFGVYDGIIKKGRKRGERKERGKGEERRQRRRREGSGREVELCLERCNRGREPAADTEVA